jgi:lipopolysaccharide export system permease protein
MAILTRYLIRCHVGPFLFSLTLITGLLFLNTIAQRLDQFVGKGLPWTVLAEFALLALPHTVALTLPMSVLVAVLYAFSDLTAENEITAMAGGGVNPVRILVPLVGIGVILAGGMFLFNDRVLPEANHRLKNLLVDIGRKSPTFQLRDQVVNEIGANTARGRRVYFLQAVHIDAATSTMEDIVIYDVSDPAARRTTYAERGTMAFSPDQTDLYLTLYDGTVFEVPSNRVGGFQRANFREQFLPIRGIANVLERGSGAEYRSDREMSTDMLAAEAETFVQTRARLLAQARRESVDAVKKALGWELRGDTLAPPPPGPDSDAEVAPADLGDPLDMAPDDMTRGVVLTTRSNAEEAERLRLQAIKYRVEIHKKYAIAFACIVFVLIGAPLALRFPRGGVGMVITVSVAVFSLFWVSLIGGESLADNGLIGPGLSMWLANLVLLPVGGLLVSRMSRQVATARGGGWEDLLATLAAGVQRPFLRLARRGGGKGE